MNRRQAKEIIKDSGKGTKTGYTYLDMLNAAKTLIPDIVRDNPDITSSSIISKLGGNFDVMVNIAIVAMDQMVDQGQLLRTSGFENKVYVDKYDIPRI